MTKPKPPTRKAKMGRKSKRQKTQQDKILKMISSTKGLTPWEASLIVGCGYEYALQKLREIRNYYQNLTY